MTIFAQLGTATSRQTSFGSTPLRISAPRTANISLIGTSHDATPHHSAAYGFVSRHGTGLRNMKQDIAKNSLMRLSCGVASRSNVTRHKSAPSEARQRKYYFITAALGMTASRGTQRLNGSALQTRFIGSIAARPGLTAPHRAARGSASHGSTTLSSTRT